MNKTNIDWKNLTHTWNPIVGCRNGCEYCYARKLHDKRHKAYFKGKVLPVQYAKPFDTIQFFPERLLECKPTQKPRTIFVGSICDIFSPGVDMYWVQQIIDTARKCPQHTFMFLTKLPVGYMEFDWPVNCWLGATIESEDEYWRKIPLVGHNSNNKKFVSIEPILSGFDMNLFTGIDLIIIGADSTPCVPVPPLEWILSVKHPNIWYKNSVRKLYPELKNKPQ